MPVYTLMKKQSLTLITVILLSLVASTAMADIMDGDFSNGGGDWTVSADPGFSATFPGTGGIPGAFARLYADFPNTGGQVCISQTFMCGDVDQGTECTVGFDYILTPIDANQGSARIIVIIDGFVSVVVDHATADWESVSYVVPCGQHTIEICLEVDPDHNMWEAGIDNVRAACTGGVANEIRQWDGIKTLYR